MFRAVGAVDDEELLTYRRLGSRLEGHPTPRLPWVDVATGSLGQGLPIGVGIALALSRLESSPARVWVLCGDSELAEGSIWEAFEHASFNRLDRLTAVVDVNRLGQRGETMVGWNTEVDAARARAFGWEAIEIDGHDLEEIDRAFTAARETTGKPTVVLARTKKGRGVAAVEDKEGMHGKPLPDAEAAIEELGGRSSITVAVQKPDGGGERRGTPAAGDRRVEPPRYEQGARVATRKAYGEALVALGAAYDDVVVLDGEVVELDLRRPLRGRVPRALLRGLHRRAAARRRRRRHAGAGLPALRIDLRRVPQPCVRLRADGGGEPGVDRALRFARRRLDRRGRAVADGPRGHRLAAGDHGHHRALSL